MKSFLLSVFLLILFTFAGSSVVFADSFLSLPQSDLLEVLKAPEAVPLTRKAQVIYPAPGLPSLVRPGQEVVVRLRVRRAMTPPPGIQQHHIIRGWTAKLVRRDVIAANGTSGRVEYDLNTFQIRAEDEGFVYRVRFKVPHSVADGLYDLVFRGPGVFDVRRRAVRVLAEGQGDIDLVVASGDRLWREAESLWLTDPVALLVPGGMTEASEALSRWPLATFAVPSPSEIEIHRELDLSAEEFRAILQSEDCPSEPVEESVRCVVAALGGPEVLDLREDRLVRYLRQIGPPAFASTIGDVVVVGLNSSDHISKHRTSAHLRVGEDRFGAHFNPEFGRRWQLGKVQRGWFEKVRNFGNLIVLTGLDPGQREIEIFRKNAAAIVQPSSRPSIIRLERVQNPSLQHPIHLNGLDPRAYRFGGVRSRSEHGPAGLRVFPRESGHEGVEVVIDRAPAEKFQIPFLLPANRRGWAIKSEQREAQIAGIWPARDRLCSCEEIFLVAEVKSGGEGPIRLEVFPAQAEGQWDLRFDVVGDGIIVGRSVVFSADGHRGSEFAVFWDFGDKKTGRGKRIAHTYIRSGPSTVCATAIDREGRVFSWEQQIFVDRWAENRGKRVGGWALIVVAGICLLFAVVKGNIFPRRRRFRWGTEA